MVYYMDNSILIASGEKELTGILNTLARYMQAIGLKINFTKIQGLTTIVNFLVTHCSG